MAGALEAGRKGQFLPEGYQLGMQLTHTTRMHLEVVMSASWVTTGSCSSTDERSSANLGRKCICG